MKLKQYLVDVIGISRTSKNVSNHLKNVFDPLRIVDVSIHDKLKGCRIVKERELQIPIVVERFETVRRHEVGRRSVKLAGNFVKEIGSDRIDRRVSQILVDLSEEAVAANPIQ